MGIGDWGLGTGDWGRKTSLTTQHRLNAALPLTALSTHHSSLITHL
ncbi:hypothetical protein [Nostoc sp. CMAA1605]|nr:hypothetical protein [Nostoc sp. CMAA1605]